MIVASGARYQRLAVDDLERFEGAGVYYAATDLEARICSGSDVIVVGGGNSAGQAAIYLAQQGSRVSIAIRGDDLADSMSQYLIERIEADPRIEVLTAHRGARARRRPAPRAGHARAHADRRATRTVACTGLFCFIGADPATEWLGDASRSTPRASSSPTVRSPTPRWRPARSRARDPLPFETSVPGVFAVGDVRHGSLKRVAAAVGEGSSAVRSVHDHLASRSDRGRAEGYR